MIKETELQHDEDRGAYVIRRPLIVGEAMAPECSPSESPLSAIRVGSTGWRLWQMMRLHVDITLDEYHDTFDRRNLCRQAWSYVEARRVAQVIRELSPEGQVVVMLGSRVRAAMRVHAGVNPDVVRGVWFYSVPHPSGLNRWYNDAANRSHVGKLLAGIYERSIEHV